MQSENQHYAITVDSSERQALQSRWMGSTINVLKMLEIDYLQRNKNQPDRTSNEHLQLYNLASPSYDMQPVIGIDQPLMTSCMLALYCII